MNAAWRPHPFMTAAAKLSKDPELRVRAEAYPALAMCRPREVAKASAAQDARRDALAAFIELLSGHVPKAPVRRED